MPPTASIPPRKRSNKPYDPSDRPRPSKGSSTGGSLPGESREKVAIKSTKPRPTPKDHHQSGMNGLKGESKLQRIRSNESLSRRDEEGEYKKNKKKRRKVPVVASSSSTPLAVDAGPEKRSLENREAVGGNGIIEKPATPKPATTHPPSSPGSKPMMHTAMDQHMKALNRKNAEIERLQLELQTAKEEAGRMEKEMKEKVSELERQNREHREERDGTDKKLEEHRVAQEALAEACQCGVCMDTLDDPHTLSCGHIACKKCLISWFRTAGAYPSYVPSPIPADLDLSYWRKSCHVCRAIVIHRPTRLFFLGDILGPLGIDPHLPSASQQAAADPWDKIFPPERATYRIFDEDDHVERCPSCGFEIMDAICTHCAAEFSVDEEEEFDEQDFDLQDGDLSDGEAAWDEAEAGANQYQLQWGLPRQPFRAGRRGRAGQWALERVVGGGEGFVDDEASVTGSDGSSELSGESDGSEVDSELQDGQEVLARTLHRARNRSPQDDIDMDLDRHRMRRVFRAQPEDDEDDDDRVIRADEEDEDEDEYEDSFIDDGSEAAAGAYRGGDGDEESDDMTGTNSADDEGDSNDESDTSGIIELDQPTADEMRRRRLGRIERPPVAPPRRVASNDAPVRAPGPARRPRAIIIDSDEDD